MAIYITVTHLVGDPTTYASDDTDTARGTILIAAVGDAVTGDSISLTANTFNIQTNHLDLSLGNTITDVDLIGAGKLTTIIQSSWSLIVDGSYAIVHPSNNSIVKDLSIVGTLTGEVYQSPWGAGTLDSAFTGAELTNVYLEAESDGIYINKDSCSGTISNITSVAKMNPLMINSYDSIFDVYTSAFTAVGNVTWNGPNAILGCGGVINLYTCSISNSSGTVYSKGITSFYKNVLGTRYPATINVYDCTIETDPDTGTSSSFYSIGAIGYNAGCISTVNVYNSSYNRSRIYEGSFSSINEYGTICLGYYRADESYDSWQKWEISDGVKGTIRGSTDWGTLELYNDTPIYSPVIDTGNVNSKTFTIQKDKYDSGSGVVAIYIRGGTSAILQHDALPAWSLYTEPITETWQYVQSKLLYPLST